jgi:redox-sensitive bicupin YhaK (pirin superfamily)
MMMSVPPPVERRISRVEILPEAAPGFAGPRHSAVPVFLNDALEATDPFILLADDRVSGSGPFGEAHPHAGLETVTLMLKGEIHDRHEGILREGDVEWMTAGRGIIHNESVETRDDMRLLQLWIRMPAAVRNAQPRVQRILRESVPVRYEPGARAVVYSGTSGNMESPTLNHVPVTLLDIVLESGALLNQNLPAAYNGFLLVLDGAVLAGEEITPIRSAQVGWLDRPSTVDDSNLSLRGGESGGRVLLYAGMPQGTPIATHGPFVGCSRAEIAQHYSNYQAGAFARASTLLSRST